MCGEVSSWQGFHSSGSRDRHLHLSRHCQRCLHSPISSCPCPALQACRPSSVLCPSHALLLCPCPSQLFPSAALHRHPLVHHLAVRHPAVQVGPLACSAGALAGLCFCFRLLGLAGAAAAADESALLRFCPGGCVLPLAVSSCTTRASWWSGGAGEASSVEGKSEGMSRGSGSSPAASSAASLSLALLTRADSTRASVCRHTPQNMSR